MSTTEEGVPEFVDMPLPTEPLPVEPPVDTAEYLDTQTLDGGDGYFHTENDEEHQSQQSPPTDLVTASETGDDTGDAEPGNGDGLDALDLQALRDLATSRGLDFSPQANRRTLLKLLRA